MRTKHDSDAAFEMWVDGADQLRTHSVQAAFREGWNAREKAPNTLIIDTTTARMTPALNVNAAAGVELFIQTCPRCGSPLRSDGICSQGR
jgi:hypothetical protein